MQWFRRWMVFFIIFCGISNAQRTVPGRYGIKFKDSTVDAATRKSRIVSLLSALQNRINFSGVHYRSFVTRGSALRSGFPFDRYAIIDIDSVQNQSLLVQTLHSDPSIAIIEPSYYYSIDSVPNDSAYSTKWNLVRIGVYLYRVERLDQSGGVKNSILGKMVVVR